MATLQEQIQAIEKLIGFLDSDLVEFTEQVLANDLTALVTNRVVQKGLNYKNQKFKPYSTKTVAAFRFWGLSRTQTAEKKVRALSRSNSALSYREFRRLNNLKVDKKNFEFTGEMWRKFGVIRSLKSGGRFSVRIGGTTPTAAQKINDNSNREGVSIIEASDHERAIVQKTTQDWILDNAQRILNV